MPTSPTSESTFTQLQVSTGAPQQPQETKQPSPRRTTRTATSQQSPEAKQPSPRRVIRWQSTEEKKANVARSRKSVEHKTPTSSPRRLRSTPRAQPESTSSSVLVVGENKVRLTSDRHDRSLFSISDIIECQQQNAEEKWLTAMVEFDHCDGTYDVVFDSGDRERKVPSSRLRPRVFSF